MTTLLISSIVIGGTGTCNVAGQRAYGYVQQQRNVNRNYNVARVAVNYNANQRAYVPVHKIDYRASYVGFSARSEEQAQQLLIIDQLVKSQARALDQSTEDRRAANDRVRELEGEKSAILQGALIGTGAEGQPSQPQPQPQPQQPPPQPQQQQLPQAPAQTAAPVLKLFETHCAKCHTGDQGKTHGWVMDLKKLAQPSVKLRLRVGDAINRPQNPMPKGGKLTAAERQAFNQWATFTKQELVEEDK